MNKEEKIKANEELVKAYYELVECRKKMNELRRKFPAEQIDDYQFLDIDSRKVSLHSLFGDKDDLIVIHNMGKSCSYCTMWADGFNGVRHHLENRAAFVLVSPDAPDILKEFAKSRDWGFNVLSNSGGAFTKDMGYESTDGSPLPGVSTFHRDADGNVSRIAHSPFGPGDDFCAVWNLFDMLKDGTNNWQPEFEYV